MQIAGLITLIASLGILAVAMVVVWSTREAVPDGNVPVYRVRKYYAAALGAVLVAALALTLPRTPYAAYAASEPAVLVEVKGIMWSWQIQRAGGPPGAPLVLPSGKVIDFDVTGGDVNHGFGVYDPQGRLLGQTQAMPGYHNHLRMVFDVPGRYHVLCLEFCGIAHHAMLSEFTVR